MNYTLRPARSTDRQQIKQLMRYFQQERSPHQAVWHRLIASAIGGLMVYLLVYLVMQQNWLWLYTVLGLLGAIGLLVKLGSDGVSGWQQFWVIELENQILGCAKLCRYSSYALLFNVIVAPPWRQQGVGSTLVKYVVQQSNRPLYLACAPSRVNFYARLGFQLVRPQQLPPIVVAELGLGSRRIVPMVLRG